MMSPVADALAAALKIARDGLTELVCETERLYLTRFADSEIHQNIGRYRRTVWCRVAMGKRVGIASGNDLSRDGLSALVHLAREICRHQREDQRFDSFAVSPTAPPGKGYVEATARFSPMARAQAIKSMCRQAADHALQGSGFFQTSMSELAVVNSLGTRQYGQITEARISLTLSDGDGRAGFAQGCARDVSRLDYEMLARRAVAQASSGKQLASIEPGRYTVILDPEAVADFLLFLGFLGFGAKGLSTGRSFLADRIGEKVMSERITITEDPLSEVMACLTFDYEGVPRRRVALVEKGIAKGVVYDTYYAHIDGVESTGNALQPGNDFGPYPKAMVMEPGTKTIEQLVAESDKAIWIARFWYLNYLDPMRTVVTGTTREGTLVVEEGQVVGFLPSVRIVQSMLEAFSNVVELSSERRLVPKYGALMYVPAMKVTDFNLVGQT